MKPKITIKNIAKNVGCAPSMVSMAMNNKPGISAALKERILKAAAEANWAPLQASATLRKGRSNKILMVLPYDGLGSDIMANNTVIALLDSLTKSLQGSPFDIDIAFETEDPEILYPQLNRQRQPAAFIFMNIFIDDWRHRWLTDENIPFVSFGQTQNDLEYNFVDFDNRQYTFEATSLAIEKGYREIYLFSSSLEYTYTQELNRGFKEAFEQYGLPFNQDHIYLRSNLREGYDIKKFIAERLKNDAKGKAFIFSDDVITVPFIYALQDIGCDIKKDVFMTSFSSCRIIEMLAPFVHVWRQDLSLAGKTMAKMIIECLSQDKPKYQHKLFYPQQVTEKN